MTNWHDWFSGLVAENGDSPEAAHYDSVRSFEIRQRLVLDWIGNVQNKTILDIGAATGHFSQPLAAQNTVIGADFVAEMLGYAANKGLLPLLADGMKLPLQDKSVDIIICVGVLQHIDNIEHFFRELLRVKKPDGQLYLVTLNQDSWVRKLYYMLPSNQETMHTYQIPQLVRLVSEIAPQEAVDSGVIYYPAPGYRRVGRQPGLSKFLSTAFCIRVG